MSDGDLAAARAGLDASVRVFETGWNAHDANALATAFHTDASFVNRFGRLVRGRDAIAAMHAPLFASVYRASTMKGWVESVDLLADGVASGYARLDLDTGDSMPGGARDVPGRMLAVLTRRDGAWAIAAATNVAMVDPITGEPNSNL